MSVGDAAKAYEVSTANGARGVLPPTGIADKVTGTTQLVSEVELYGDVVMRFLSGDYKVPPLLLFCTCLPAGSALHDHVRSLTWVVLLVG